MANMLQKDSSYKPQPQSRLLSLPPELRNHIYELVLSTPACNSQASLIKHYRRRLRHARTERDTAHIQKTLDLLCRRSTAPSNTDSISSITRQNQPAPHVINLTPRLSIKPRTLDLLLTCRQILAEAEGIFYSLNHLCYKAQENPERRLKGIATNMFDLFSPMPELPHFIASLSPRRQLALRTVTLMTPSMEAALEELTIRLLPNARNLQRLYLELPLAQFDDDAEVEVWATQVQKAMQGMQVKDVKVRNSGPEPPRMVAGWHAVGGGVGGSVNMQWHVLYRHLDTQAAARTIEEMLESVLFK